MTPGETMRRLHELRIEHRDLDVLIEHLGHSALADEIALKRMKKRKLRLKDMITILENQMIPDQPA